MGNIDLTQYFMRCRKSVYDAGNQKFLLAKIGDSEQEKDLSVPSNCDGYGRIRHFRRYVDEDWMFDPLPIDPACKALAIPYIDMLKTQVFQIASCNVHCWYCFVPDGLKIANLSCSRWFTCDEMVQAYLSAGAIPKVIDLSGGNPELVPEWVIGMMKSLEKFDLSDKVYLWSDDTLTTDYTFRFLKPSEIDYFRKYKNYGKVCCFKGFDDISFSFNCNLPNQYFERQFENFERYLELGIDLYGYITLTSDNYENIDERISVFMDRLQGLHSLLPLKIVPLKIQIYSPVKHRISRKHIVAMRIDGQSQCQEKGHCSGNDNCYFTFHVPPPSGKKPRSTNLRGFTFSAYASFEQPKRSQQRQQT